MSLLSLTYIKLTAEQADGTTDNLYSKDVSYFVDNHTMITLMIV